ncbi:MAG: FHA domain-containing protein [Clostridia bacterium]|nr:FHA domain-containing protein [Clostridia bacterium]
MLELVLSVSHYMLPLLAVVILLLCFSALFKRRQPPLGRARLVNTANGDSFLLTTRETSIGRHKTCDIILNYPTVSRVQAVIVCSNKGWYITGVGSVSGVAVNGKKIEKKEFLKTGDRITLANINLIFENKKD